MCKKAGANQSTMMLLGMIAVGTLGSGCSSLRPPAEDRAVLEYEQKQAEQSPQEKNPANLIYPLLTGLASAFGR